MPCKEDNSSVLDQSTFWDSSGMHWDAHRIGWAISGGCAVLTLLITLCSVWGHLRHYYVPSEQRQILRILYMPPVFAIISFFSYRFFRDYTYYSLVEVIYESFVLSAFLLLIIQYVAKTSANRTAEDALARKDKTRLIIPFCCLYYRPTKPYFMYTLKWAVMQYTIFRPACSIAGIITQYYGVLCDSETSIHYASVYIEAVDFASISIALMGLIVFYDLTKNELKGRRPLAKFLCIKLIVMVTWYQSFVFSLLQTHGVIKATEYWTGTNIADGLNALATCIEMVLFAIFMWWAYPASEYIKPQPTLDPSNPKSQEDAIIPAAPMTDDEKERRAKGITSIWKPLWDSINYSDFAREIWSSLSFFFDYFRGKPEAHSGSIKKKKQQGRVSFGSAFNLEGSSRGKIVKSRSKPSEDLSGVGLIRARTPTSEAGTYSNGNGTSVEHARSEEGMRMGEAYRMSPISSQPPPRESPQFAQPGSPASQQGLMPQQPDQNTRWSRVGMAL